MSSPGLYYPGVGNQVPLKERVRLGEITDSSRTVTNRGRRLDDRPEDGLTGLFTETLLGHDRPRYLPGRHAPIVVNRAAVKRREPSQPSTGPLQELRHALLSRGKPPRGPSVHLRTPTEGRDDSKVGASQAAGPRSGWVVPIQSLARLGPGQATSVVTARHDDGQCVTAELLDDQAAAMAGGALVAPSRVRAGSPRPGLLATPAGTVRPLPSSISTGRITSAECNDDTSATRVLNPRAT